MEQVHHTIGAYLFILSHVASLGSVFCTFYSFLILLLGFPFSFSKGSNETLKQVRGP